LIGGGAAVVVGTYELSNSRDANQSASITIDPEANKPIILITPIPDFKIEQERFPIPEPLNLDLEGFTSHTSTKEDYIISEPKPDVSGISNTLTASDTKNGAKEKSASQLQREIEKGLAPRGIIRVEKKIVNIKGKTVDEIHVHLDNGGALNKDGTWKHQPTTSKDISNKQKEWLKNNGFKLPDN
jgi:hypothetical protein